MLVDIDMNECAYIAMVVSCVRNAANQAPVEQIEESLANILLMEDDGIGNNLLVKLQTAVERDAECERLYQ